MTTVGVVRNRRSHANRGQASEPPEGLRWAEPETPQALVLDMKRFAAAGVDLVVIDGGDGTVREVLSALPEAYGDRPPVLAVLASGKTNVLALDLGAGRDWTLAEVLRRAATDAPRLKSRAPLEVSWSGQPPVRGFILGLGAFTRATQMSKAVHRMGAYQSLSVALTLAGAALGTFFGHRTSPWRQGVEASVAVDGAAQPPGRRFVVIATALKRLPFGLKPFGLPREGMKVLDVDAPPRGLLAALPRVLGGRSDLWLAARGYRRRSAERLDLHTEECVVIDGEVFPGGAISVRLGPPLRFLVP